MELRIGDPVIPALGRVDLCTGIDMYHCVTIMERDHLGIVLETYTQNVIDDPGRVVRYAKILSPSGISGWCLSRFIIPASQQRRG